MGPGSAILTVRASHRLAPTSLPDENLCIIRAGRFTLQSSQRLFHLLGDLLVILLSLEGEGGTDLDLNLSGLRPLMVDRIDLIEPLEVNGNHRDLQSKGHESDARLKGLEVSIRGASPLRVNQRAMPLIDSLARVLESPPDTWPPLRQGIGVEEPAGQKILTCRGHSFLPGSPKRLKVSPEKVLCHGRGQAPAPRRRKSRKYDNRVQVTHVIGHEDHRRVNLCEMFQAFNV
jgi:hypothetical protein